MVKKKSEHLRVYLASMLLFVVAIIVAYNLGVTDYINDSIFMMLILTLLFFLYDGLRMTSWIYFSVAIAFLLHNLGMFGFYSVSPIFIQWDHVTHFFGELVAGVALYNMFYSYKMLNGKKTKTERFTILMVVVFAALGIGVIIEFMEFFGYLFVGEGLGIFAHGIGDVNTEFINSEWFNTMFDLIYNFLGALFGVLLCHFGLNKKVFRKN
ncbi:hypothetical protein HN992_02800 [Candidatus Woesearchaeota archaeon]|jgi:hypothetical protein|nr:hypothetical protein [Candidatus Woesearchaeota archaeon]MBT5043206.1 hypothetical protein [Candidatus Woesearchaeota archaeon]MBT6941347.1 hypothetical protein [Candidatus Woesearchaeota archaeon]